MIAARDAADRVAETISSRHFLLGEQLKNSEFAIANENNDEDSEIGGNSDALVYVSYCIGCTFGRWDFRYATGMNEVSLNDDPFAALPRIAPGAWVGGLDGFPLFLVDDETHEMDSLAKIRYVMSEIWGDRAEQVEIEACELLNVRSLRDYFGKPNGFFADHLAMYSRSRRQAPIYWPLSTKSGSLTVWVYYHRLDQNTLPRLITEVLDPKLRQINEQLASMAGQSRGTERRLELEALALEVSEMKTAFQGLIDRGYRPNLNDGVLITACPLSDYFRLPKWQKELKTCWKELERGDYDWAHLAMSMWPERVLKACAKDRSIAIAHGREDLCPAEAPRASRGRRNKST